MAILTFEVKGQTLTVKSSIGRIVENSVNYLNYDIVTSDPDWMGLAKKLIITTSEGATEIGESEQEYIPNKKIISPGFQVSIVGYSTNETGEELDKRITTYPIFISVSPAGPLKGADPDNSLPVPSEGEVINDTFNEVFEEIQKTNDTINEISNNKTNNFSSPNNENYPTTKAVSDFVGKSILTSEEKLNDDISLKETASNKVEEIEDETSTNNYPSVKAVVDFVKGYIPPASESVVEGDGSPISSVAVLKFNNNVIKPQTAEKVKEVENNVSNALRKNKTIEEGKIVSVDDVSPVEHNMIVKTPSLLTKGYYNSSVSPDSHVKNLTYRTIFFEQGEYSILEFPKKVNVMRKITSNSVENISGLGYDNIDSISLAGALKDAIGVSFRLNESNTDPWPSTYTVKATRPNGDIDYFADIEFIEGKTIFTAGKNLFNENNLYNDFSGIKYRAIELYLPAGKYVVSGTKKLYFQGYEGDISGQGDTNSEARVYTVTKSGIVKVRVRKAGDDVEDWDDEIKLQVESGTVATPYEQYVGDTYQINSDGLVEGVKSISPFMQVYSDHSGLPLSFEYNQDINKAYAELQSNYNKLKIAIEKLGGTIE